MMDRAYRARWCTLFLFTGCTMRQDIEKAYQFSQNLWKEYIDTNRSYADRTELLVRSFGYCDSVIRSEHLLEDGVEFLHWVRHHTEEVIYELALKNNPKSPYYGQDYGDEATLVRRCWSVVDGARDNDMDVKQINLYMEILLLLARSRDFDAYLLYLERKRRHKDRFYLPKRKQFLKHGITQCFQDMLDDKLDIMAISLIPGGGKTTILKFFTSAVIGWDERKFNLFFSHSSDITRMYYDGVLDICTNNDEYAWNEIFYNAKITNTNAKMGQFNVGSYKPFPSLQTTSKGAENAGKVRCNGYLLVDDLIGSQEEALNIKQLDKLWDNTYTVDARQRKLEGCKEIHIATRWSVHDVIGRLQRLYDGNDRVRFIAIPDIDPDTGESNFDYEVEGFTVEFFNDIALAMDELSYKALYKSEPMEREGLLYHEEDLRRYLSLPDKEPDAILGVCDVKGKGTDYMFLPVMYQYGEDFYLADAICDDNADYEVQYAKLTDILANYKVQACEFESNAGGDRVAAEVQKRLIERGCTCTITTHPTETNKETRIIVNAEWVKKRVLFRDKSLYSPKDDYGVMMNWLLCYSTVGKNNHDDVPDGLANFRLYVTGMQPQLARVEAIFNPFRSRGNY